jgi:hypothetical protein
MPEFEVRLREAQDALYETRRLVTPGGAGALLGVTRQAVHDAARRATGKVLLWEFRNRRLPRREWEMYVDFGARDEPESATAWLGRTAEELIGEAVERYRARTPLEGEDGD